MKRLIGNHLILLIMTGIIAFFPGCVSLGPNKPNIPFAGNSYPSIFHNLYKDNPLLVEELGKLPELQDGISVDEKYALEKLIELYDENPNAFNKAFEEMYQIGIPDVRKYCSPLQALFWLAEEGELDDAKDILRDYSLVILLETAWDFELKPIPFSDEQISMIIDNMKDKRLQKLFLENKNDTKYLQRLIHINYKHQPELFKRKALEIIKEVKSENEDMRWKDYDVVTDRLNSPELVNYYERKRFQYVFQTGRDISYTHYLFRTNRGQCTDVTDFTVYCLRKAGYKANRCQVDSPTGRNYHWVCSFRMNGKSYIMDNGRPDKLRRRGIIPFSEYNPFID